MARVILASGYATLAFIALLAGCATPSGGRRDVAEVSSLGQAIPATVPAARSEPNAPPAVSPVAYQSPTDALPTPPMTTDRPLPHEAAVIGPAQPALEPVYSQQGASVPLADAPQSAYNALDACDPFNGQGELDVCQLVAEVQARNPSLQAVSAAWRAATQRYPQVVSLDDPMFNTMLGPQGLGTEHGGGWMVQGSQKVPWAGKRALRGSVASAEAMAMKGDVGDVRLRLAEAARTAFYDYYLARRQMDVTASTQVLLKQFREIATNKYQVGQATEQDVLQADVEIATLQSRCTELTRDEQVAVARINTLLHREANHPLPPPPVMVAIPAALPTADALQQAAIQCRPDLYAIQARIRAEKATLELAYKEYYPDLSLVARYDGFMPEKMRPQVGMELNIPIRHARRSAAVCEAENKVAQRCAEYQDRLDQVRYEVQTGFDRVSQSQRVVCLYEQKILPATQRSLDSAVANYTSGKLDFLRLLDAERQLNTQREMYYQAIADYHRRLAELELAVGEPVGNCLQ